MLLYNASSMQALSPTTLIRLSTASQRGASLVHLGVACNRWDSVSRFSFKNLVALVCDAPPTAGLVAVLDPFHGGEVVVVLLHRNHPGHRVKGDCLEAEICSAKVSSRISYSHSAKGAAKDIQVLSGIFRVAAMNVSRSGVGSPLTWVMKLVGATPYWYAGEPRILLET